MSEADLANAAWWSWLWGEIEHWAFLGVVVALAIEFAALKFGAPHKEKLESAKDLKIAELNKETARLRTQDALTSESLLANVRASRSNAITGLATRTVTERISVAQGLVDPRSISEAGRSLNIIPKVASFTGKRFDATVTSTDIELGTLLVTLESALKSAGWIEIELGDPTAGVGLLSMDRAGGPALVRIEVDASKDPELSVAAKTLASALNAEGIAATVHPKTETDTTNVIHIMVGPKP